MEGQTNGGSLALISMILGIVSLVFLCCCTIISIPTSIGGAITGIIAIKNNQENRNMAIAGIACSAISIVIAIILMVLGMMGTFLELLGMALIF